MASEFFEIESSLAPVDAFALVVDLLNVDQWDPGVTSPRHTEGTPGVVGATYEVTVMGFDRQPTQAVYELTAVDAPRSFTMVGRHADFRADDTVTFEVADGGCRVSYDASLVLLGDNPPVNEQQLDSLFASLADVPRQGLTSYLNR